MSTDSQTLLLEIGTEELPAGALLDTARQLADSLAAAVSGGGLSHSGCQFFVTPRRLAVRLQQVPLLRSGSSSMRMGPALAVARNEDGSWSKAAHGFARGCGADPQQLQIISDSGNERIACEVVEPARQASELLPDMVHHAVSQLRFSRSMHWGTCTQHFLRPVRWLLLLHGATHIELNMFGISSGSHSYGHRQHHPQAVEIEHADQWQDSLRQAMVIACAKEREQRIREMLAATSQQLGYVVHAPDELVYEVNAMVEWPVVVHGRFDESYLQLPQPLLLSVMQKQQRYFPLYKDNSKEEMVPAFIAVIGLASTDSNIVVRGNENVLRPRLSDADFFWRRDCADKLQDRLAELEGIVFHSRLGSIAERSAQIADAAAAIATLLGLDAAAARRAGELCKCDLVTLTVGEFPELQGTIGGLLAANDGEPELIVQSIAEHYKPVHAGDSIASTMLARVLALADKLNMVAGIFSIDEMPAADKDPFAVRRAAIAVLRTIIEADIDVNLSELLAIALRPFNGNSSPEQLVDFFTDRLRVVCIEEGAAPQVVDAVLAVTADNPLAVKQRVTAMQAFIQLPQSAQLIATHKRVRNILRQSGSERQQRLQPDSLIEPAECALAEQLVHHKRKCAELLPQRDYQTMLQGFAAIQPVVDTFFAEVKVMAEDSELRANRLALLTELAAILDTVADLTRLDG